MRQTWIALVLGLTTFTSAAVHAEQRVDAAGFVMSAPGYTSPYNSLSLLSDIVVRPVSPCMDSMSPPAHAYGM